MVKFDAAAGKKLLPLQMGAPDIEQWLLARDPKAIGAYNEMGPQEYARSFAAAQTAGTDLIDDIYFGMVDVVSRGGDEKDFAALVSPIMKQKGWLQGDDRAIANRVSLIYDTNLRLARASGRWDRYQSTKQALPYLRAFTVGDDRVRHPPKSPHADHRAWQGIVLPVDHWFWRIYWPPLGFRCFLPQTRIEGDVKAGIRRWHSGKAVEVTMVSGRRLSVTPDHAILTSRGWVVAEHIRVGDHTLSKRGIVSGESDIFGRDNDAPPRADDLFQAVTTQALGFREPSTLQLNDQTNGRESKIDVAFADPILAQECRAKMLGEQILIRADLGSYRALSGFRPVQEGAREFYAGYAGQASNLRFAHPELLGNAFHGPIRIGSRFPEPSFKFDVSVPAGLPSLSALPLNATRRLFDGLPLDRFRLGSSTDEDALFDELASDGTAVDFGLFGELLHAHAGSVGLDEVVEVREFDFSGHVYDFQTSEGIVLADGIVAHNCRCGINQMTRSQFARLKDGVTSEDELQHRIALLGPPVFASPAQPIRVQLAGAVRATNQDIASGQSMPGMNPVVVGDAVDWGAQVWRAIQAAGVTSGIDAIIASLFGM